MSIRPIDYQTSLLNSVNEAKTKLIDYNRLKDNSQNLEVIQQNLIKRNQKKVINTEQCTDKKVDNKKKEQSKSSKEKNKKDQDKTDEEVKLKGQKLDIFI